MFSQYNFPSNVFKLKNPPYKPIEKSRISIRQIPSNNSHIRSIKMPYLSGIVSMKIYRQTYRNYTVKIMNSQLLPVCKYRF